MAPGGQGPRGPPTAVPRVQTGAMTDLSPPRWARASRLHWAKVATPVADPRPFGPEMTETLPDPVARWLRHAIEPGTALGGAVQIGMHGQIRVGQWRPFHARQVINARGFVWVASARFGPVPVRGFDRYVDAEGEMRWRLLGAIPVMSARDADITRSAAGRLAVEILVAPFGALFPNVTWRAIDDEHAEAQIEIDGETHAVTIAVDDVGRLASVVLPRWGNPLGEPFGHYPFGVEMTDERPFGGMLLPAHVDAGWFYGTERWSEGEFFRADIDEARFI
jgi:hypothetical protein